MNADPSQKSKGSVSHRYTQMNTDKNLPENLRMVFSYLCLSVFICGSIGFLR
jgi:hypothetical protein